MFETGEAIGPYNIIRRLGAGGMGEVYLAEHRHIGRKAAIKVLLPDLSSNQDVVSRFFNEARATARIRHPGIVEILECDVHASGRAYIVMEALEGESLGDCLGRIGSFAEDINKVGAIVGQIASALAAAHAQGIIHRDLKPDNVFLLSAADAETTSRIKILDFGIAKLAKGNGGEVTKTRTGSLLGTPLYMSPEQCRGVGNIDHRSDIYSLGCIAYELASGRPPFIREGMGDLIVAHISEQPTDLASIVPQVPHPLNQIVMRMLAKNPEERQQSMLEVVGQIEGLLKVGAARFGTMILPPERTSATTTPLQPNPVARTTPLGKLPSGTPVPGANSGSRQNPTPHPIGAGGTKLLVEKKTTFSQTASEIDLSRVVLPRRTWPRVAAAGVGVATVGVVLYLVLAPPPRTPATPDPSPSAPVGGTVAEPVAIPPTKEPPTRRHAVTIDAENGPPGIAVDVDGRPERLPVSLPFGDSQHVLTFKAPGFQDEVARIDGTRDRTIMLSMKPVEKAPTASAVIKKKKLKHNISPGGADDSTPAQPVRKKHDGFTDL